MYDRKDPMYLNVNIAASGRLVLETYQKGYEPIITKLRRSIYHVQTYVGSDMMMVIRNEDPNSDQ